MFAGALSTRRFSSRLAQLVRSIQQDRLPFRQEIVMTQKTQRPPSKPVPDRPPTPMPPSPQTQPAEPIEVLGRHKNTGQKDHKGAR